jgi:hypothetical protein
MGANIVRCETTNGIIDAPRTPARSGRAAKR